MNHLTNFAAMATKANVLRLVLVIAGAMAMAWACAVFPGFWSDNVIVDVAGAVTAGEAFKPEVLAAVEARTETSNGSRLRSSVLGKAAVIRLRQTEDAIRAGNPELINERRESLARAVDESLRNAPDDSFLWLVWFWLEATGNGLRPDTLPVLQMSYDLGPHEGWVAIKRNRVALAAFSALTEPLAEQSISEFVSLVRWGLIPEAADIVSGTAPPLRRILFARLMDLPYDQRRAFANAIYGRELDDVPVPGIAPPTPQIRMPMMPPDL